MAIRYSASDLREQATIMSLTTTTNADFEETVALVEEAAVRCLLLPQTGRERIRAEKIEGEPRAMLVIRYRPWLTTDHVVVIGAVTYEIHSLVDVEGRRRFHELVLTERKVPYLLAEGESTGESSGESEGGSTGGSPVAPVFELKTIAITPGATSLPLPYPANPQAGEDLFVLLGIDQDNADGTTVPGFNRLDQKYIDAGSQSIYGALFHKIATGAESGSVTISFGNAADDGASAAMVRVSGGDGDVTPLFSADDQGITTAPVAPGNVLDAGPYLLFDMWVIDGNANFYDSDPDGFDNRHNSGSDGTGVSLSIASKAVTGDGLSVHGDEPHTSGGNRQTIAFSLAIKGA